MVREKPVRMVAAAAVVLGVPAEESADRAVPTGSATASVVRGRTSGLVVFEAGIRWQGPAYSVPTHSGL
jgi:hypothetical protein